LSTLHLAKKMGLALGILAVLTVSSANAYPILTWNLEDVVFASGETATGSFTLQGPNLLSWNIQVSGGTNAALTNFSLVPNAACLIFCGEVLSFRTALAPDQTEHALNLYLFDPNAITAPYSELYSGVPSTVRLNPDTDVFYEQLTSPTILSELASDNLAASATDARLELAPEPVPALLSMFGMGVLFGWRALNRKRRRASGL
jgi:hypothetical protein